MSPEHEPANTQGSLSPIRPSISPLSFTSQELNRLPYLPRSTAASPTGMSEHRGKRLPGSGVQLEQHQIAQLQQRLQLEELETADGTPDMEALVEVRDYARKMGAKVRFADMPTEKVYQEVTFLDHEPRHQSTSDDRTRLRIARKAPAPWPKEVKGLPFPDDEDPPMEKLMDLLPGWYKLTRTDQMRHYNAFGRERALKPRTPNSSLKKEGKGELRVLKRETATASCREELLVISDHDTHLANGGKFGNESAFVLRFNGDAWSCWNVGDFSQGWPTTSKAHDFLFEVETSLSGLWQTVHLITDIDQRGYQEYNQSWRRDCVFTFSNTPGVAERWTIGTWPLAEEMPDQNQGHRDKAQDEVVPAGGKFTGEEVSDEDSGGSSDEGTDET